MSAETDDDFADRLAALDEALADGATPANVAGDSIPNELQHRLKRGLAALHALRHANAEVHQDTPNGFDAPTLGGPASRATPMHFGRFHIIRELGRGGFGI